jgi:hypothetical protein
VEDDKRDLLDIPLLSDEQLRAYFTNPGGSRDPVVRVRELREMAQAEITRRQTNQQIRLLRDQGRQLDAQGKQLEIQATLTRSLTRATWVLAAATIILAVTTFLLWIWPRH